MEQNTVKVIADLHIKVPNSHSYLKLNVLKSSVINIVHTADSGKKKKCENKQPCSKPCHIYFVSAVNSSANQSNPSFRPMPFAAELSKRVHFLSRISVRPKASDIFAPFKAPGKSCLLANTSSDTPLSSSSYWLTDPRKCTPSELQPVLL